MCVFSCALVSTTVCVCVCVSSHKIRIHLHMTEAQYPLPCMRAKLYNVIWSKIGWAWCHVVDSRWLKLMKWPCFAFRYRIFAAVQQRVLHSEPWFISMKLFCSPWMFFLFQNWCSQVKQEKKNTRNEKRKNSKFCDMVINKCAVYFLMLYLIGYI